MIENSTEFNKISSRKHRKPPIHLTTYRGWEYTWLRRWIKNGAQADIQFQVDNDYSAMALVAKGFGFCLVPQSLAEIAPAPVVSLPLDKEEFMDIVIAVRGGEPCTNSVQTFVDHALQWIRSNDGGVNRRAEAKA